MNTQEKIEYLFSSETGEPTFQGYLTIRQCKLLKSLEKDDVDVLYKVVHTSDLIGEDGSNYFHEMWGKTVDDCLDTLVKDKEDGLTLPIKTIENSNKKLDAVKEYIQLVLHNQEIDFKHGVDRLEIKDDKVIESNYNGEWTYGRTWTIDEFYDEFINFWKIKKTEEDYEQYRV